MMMPNWIRVTRKNDSLPNNGEKVVIKHNNAIGLATFYKIHKKRIWSPNSPYQFAYVKQEHREFDIKLKSIDPKHVTYWMRLEDEHC